MKVNDTSIGLQFTEDVLEQGDLYRCLGNKANDV